MHWAAAFVAIAITVAAQQRAISAPRSNERTVTLTDQPNELEPGGVIIANARAFRLTEFVAVVGSDGSVATLNQEAELDRLKLRSGARALTSDARKQWWRRRRRGAYAVEDALGRGAHGEVWRAVRMDDDDDVDSSAVHYVLKRVFGTSRAAVSAGWREVYFGLLPSLSGRDGIARFVDHFEWCAPSRGVSDSSRERQGACSSQARDDENETCVCSDGRTPELWLVFRDEGVSLHALLYAPAAPFHANVNARSNGEVPESAEDGDPAHAPVPPPPRVLTPSRFWLRLRLESAHSGAAFLRSFVTQVASGLQAIHIAGVTHRDIKPGNLLLSAEGGSFSARLADFGSAVDAHATTHLYGADGPGPGEETPAYAPPEAVLGWSVCDGDGDGDDDVTGSGDEAATPHSSSCSGAHSGVRPPPAPSYDAFSLGVTMLELLLGMPPAVILAPPAREAALVRAHAAAEVRRARTRSGGHGGGERTPKVGDVDVNVDESDAESDTVQRALLVAGLRRLCIAPAGTLAPDVDDAWGGDGGEGVLHHHHHHRHHQHRHDGGRVLDDMPDGENGENRPSRDNDGREKSSPTVQPTATLCSLQAFRTLLRRADAAAQQRARDLARLVKQRDAAQVERGVASVDASGDMSTSSARSLMSWRAADSTLDDGWLVKAQGGGSSLSLAIADASPAAARTDVALRLPSSRDVELLTARDSTIKAASAARQSSSALVSLPQSPSIIPSKHDRALQLVAGWVARLPVPHTPVKFTPPAGVDTSAVHSGEESIHNFETEPDDSSTTMLDQPVPLLGEDGEELLWRLLRFSPSERATLADVVAHAYCDSARS